MANSGDTPNGDEDGKPSGAKVISNQRVSNQYRMTEKDRTDY